MLQKDHKWKWTEQCEQTFKEGKHLITSDLVLTHHGTTLPVKIACDTSPTGIGAVLSHAIPHGIENQFLLHPDPSARRNASIPRLTRKPYQLCVCGGGGGGGGVGGGG